MQTNLETTPPVSLFLVVRPLASNATIYFLPASLSSLVPPFVPLHFWLEAIAYCFAKIKDSIVTSPKKQYGKS